MDNAVHSVFYYNRRRTATEAAPSFLSNSSYSRNLAKEIGRTLSKKPNPYYFRCILHVKPKGLADAHP